MTKSTPGGIERDLHYSLSAFKDRASAVKQAHASARIEVKSDPRTSDFAKQELLQALAADTRSKLDAIRDEQKSYVRGLRDQLDRELRGSQPSAANSVLLRRDAADRARRIKDEAEALAVMTDATRSGDDSLAHAVGYRARQSGWVDALDAYREAQPGSADTAAALAIVEGLSGDPAYNMANSITYSPPND